MGFLGGDSDFRVAACCFEVTYVVNSNFLKIDAYIVMNKVWATV